MPTNGTGYTSKSLAGRRVALRSVCTLHLAGWKHQEVADALGLSGPRAVSKAVNSPGGLAIIDELQKEQVSLIHDKVMGKIEDATTDAVGTLIGLLNAESDTIKFRAATDILDRAGRRKEKDSGREKMIPHVSVNVLISNPGDAPKEGAMPIKLADGMVEVEDMEFEEDADGQEDEGE